jgi:acyl-coenzyme A thioesterase PaaI-like protein
MADRGIPDGYHYELTPSPFVNHMAKIFQRRADGPDGEDIVSVALWLEDHHLNSWNLAHGSLMAGVAELGCSGPAYVPGGKPVVTVEMSMQFIAAPKGGELLEVHGWAISRTRSLVFTQCRAEAGGTLVMFASSIQKVIGA